MRQCLERVLGAKISGIIKGQIDNGVAPIPMDQANRLMNEVAKLDLTKLRGIMVIAATEDLERGGAHINTYFAGTQQLMDALMELQAVRLSNVADHPDVAAIPPGSKRCEDCGGFHPAEADGENIESRIDAFIDNLMDPLNAGKSRYPAMDNTDALIAAMLLNVFPRRF